MDIKDKISFFIFLMLAFGGTLFAIIAWNSYRGTCRILKEGEQTRGIVINNVPKPRRGLEPRSTALGPVVKFVTMQGREVEWYCQTYTTPARFQVGEVVDIWYLPEDPHKATMQDVDAWIFPVVFGIFGAAMCLIGYPGLFKAIFR
jgi:hypothetical protein